MFNLFTEETKIFNKKIILFYLCVLRILTTYTIPRGAPLSFKWVQCPVTCVHEKDADPWVARIHMGIARVALLGEEGPGPDEDIIQPALHRRGRRQVQIVEIEI